MHPHTATLRPAQKTLKKWIDPFSFISQNFLCFYSSSHADSHVLPFFLFIVAQLYAYVVFITLPTGLAVVPTRGFYFVFVVFGKQICFGLEGVARDKLMFGILKHSHVSFQILTRYFCSLDFGTKPLINTLFILSSFLFFYYPNFYLGCLFEFSTYRVRTSDLPLGSLEAHAWCLSLPQYRALRYLLLSFVMTL